MEYTKVRILNERGVRFPVWAYAHDEGPFFDETLVSPSVRGRLLAWAREFNERFDLRTGWPTEAQRNAHLRRGRELFLTLRAQLPATVIVEEDIWETAVLEPAQD